MLESVGSRDQYLADFSQIDDRLFWDSPLLVLLCVDVGLVAPCQRYVAVSNGWKV